MTEDARNPLAVQALARRELPNLRRALAHLRAQVAHDDAAELADQIAHFLHTFGLEHERADLQQQDQAASALQATGAGPLLQAELVHLILNPGNY